MRTVVALLGRRDKPTDGVEDYCTFLGNALRCHGIELEQASVPWIEKGWIGALRQVSGGCSEWRGRWVLLQYTALAWSRRGFPFAALAVLAILRRGGARVAVVFHEPDRQAGSGVLQAVRGACQGWVIRRLYGGATKAIFADPLETIGWLPKRRAKAVFIPIGANIPERAHGRTAPALAAHERVVIVFGVTCSRETAAREVDEISDVMRQACQALGRLRLVVVGRGSVEARELLAKALHGCDVELVVRGVLPAEEVAQEFQSADALLFVRGGITPGRGSAMAGIASGIPIVGYRDGTISGPLKEAGVEWSAWHDQQSLIRGLIRVLSDPERWIELHERNLEVQKNHLSWSRIAERFQAVLAG
jgi:glycosyltransferase involved in cell wall biosynthesis